MEDDIRWELDWRETDPDHTATQPSSEGLPDGVDQFLVDAPQRSEKGADNTLTASSAGSSDCSDEDPFIDKPDQDSQTSVPLVPKEEASPSQPLPYLSISVSQPIADTLSTAVQPKIVDKPLKANRKDVSCIQPSACHDPTQVALKSGEVQVLSSNCPDAPIVYQPPWARGYYDAMHTPKELMQNINGNFYPCSMAQTSQPRMAMPTSSYPTCPPGFVVQPPGLKRNYSVYAGEPAPILHTPIPVRDLSMTHPMSLSTMLGPTQVSGANNSFLTARETLNNESFQAEHPSFTTAESLGMSQGNPHQYSSLHPIGKISPTPPTPESYQNTSPRQYLGPPSYTTMAMPQYLPRPSYAQVNVEDVRRTAELYLETAFNSLTQASKALELLHCQQKKAYRVFMQSQEPQNREASRNIWGTYCADMRCMHDMIRDSHYIFLKLLRDSLRTLIARRSEILGSKIEERARHFDSKVRTLKCHLDRFTLPSYEGFQQLAAREAQLQQKRGTVPATPRRVGSNTGSSVRAKNRHLAGDQTPKGATQVQSSP
ncbi:hypothetical protein KEM54_003174 [Ascosphaera aggregata]|nr:hypothetical protein KEM54_003174 [Ascosphaera aggregata]